MNLIWILLGALLGGLGALGGPSGHPAPAPGAEHVLVVSWSEADSQAVDLSAVVGSAPVVVETEADRDALVALVPGDLSTSELEAVDLTTHVVVAGGYHRCTESSSVVPSGDGWSFLVDDGDPGVACAWSPYAIDVWSVPR